MQACKVSMVKSFRKLLRPSGFRLENHGSPACDS